MIDKKSKKIVYEKLISEIKDFKTGLLTAGSELGMFSGSNKHEEYKKPSKYKAKIKQISPEEIRQIEAKIALEVTKKDSRKIGV